MQIFKYDKDNLSFTKLGNKFFLSLSSGLVILVVASFFIGIMVGGSVVNKVKNNVNHQLASKYDLNPEHDLAWKEATFKDYAKRATIYLSRPIFEGTPLKGQMLALCARNAYDSTGVLLPVELALAQAQWESGMGREGRSPKNNPFNVGEHDSGTVKWFDSTFEGTQSYYYWMCRTYLNCRTVDDLFVNFVNCSGKRYASRIDYESTIRNQYYSNKKWIDNNLKQK